MKIKRFIECLLPVTACNLRCSYCYVIQRQKDSGKMPTMKYSIQQISQALTQDRLGGICYFSICGAGETLLPEVTIDIVSELLKNGHLVNITTNGTLTQRFREIIEKIEKDEYERLHFSFSLHYLELLRLNKLETFVENVKIVKEAGCSFLIQFNLCDEYVPYLEEIRDFCIKNFGAMPQVAATRKENDLYKNVDLHTELSKDEYIKLGKQFESPLFEFTMQNFNVPRKEFCFAGDWAFVLDLSTGKMKHCYASSKGYDIFAKPNKAIPFCAVGKHCKSLFCMNSSHFMAMGVIPDINTPSYAQLRDRITDSGGHWFSDYMEKALSGKLENNNSKKRHKIKVNLHYIGDQLYGKVARLYEKLKRK